MEREKKCKAAEASISAALQQREQVLDRRQKQVGSAAATRSYASSQLGGSFKPPVRDGVHESDVVGYQARAGAVS